jgi:predicted RNase H-like HicB family nuclease
VTIDLFNNLPVRLASGGVHIHMRRQSFTAIIEKEGDGYVGLCPELDVASQGDTVQGALANLREAVELFLECASPGEVAERLHGEVFVTRFEAAYA